MARRDKKDSLSDQCKEIEENNGIRSLQENQRYQGTISCKDGHNEGQKQHGPKRSRRVRRGGKNKQKNYIKNCLHDTDNHDHVITHLEPDILECEVKWSLGSTAVNKASGDSGIPAELFKILKDDATKVLHSVCEQIWKTQQWPQDWKRSVLIPVPKKGRNNKCSNHQTVALISHASKVML